MVARRYNRGDKNHQQKSQTVSFPAVSSYHQPSIEAKMEKKIVRNDNHLQHAKTTNMPTVHRNLFFRLLSEVSRVPRTQLLWLQFQLCQTAMSTFVHKNFEASKNQIIGGTTSCGMLWDSSTL